jgi:hypothetical protein
VNIRKLAHIVKYVHQNPYKGKKGGIRRNGGRFNGIDHIKHKGAPINYMLSMRRYVILLKKLKI